MTHKDLLIIGYGVVGQAVELGLNQDEDNYIQILDPGKDLILLDDGINDYTDYNYYDGIILCLPTPQGPRGECDDMMVEQYVQGIRKVAPFVPILIKSTVSLELIQLLNDDVALTHNPEFLTEADSVEEFQNQKFAIFGGNNSRYWYDIFINAGIKIDKVSFTSLRNACFAKYTINCFLATKVVFFNELKNLYGDVDFDSLTELVAMDERIGSSHMMVPGPDLKQGFGGMCFPKDTLAFATSASRAGSPLKLLEEAILINNQIRK